MSYRGFDQGAKVVMPTKAPSCRSGEYQSKESIALGCAAGAIILYQLFEEAQDLSLPLTGMVLLHCALRTSPCLRAERTLDRASVAWVVCYVIASLAGQEAKRSLTLSVAGIPALGLYAALAQGASKKIVSLLASASCALVFARLASAMTESQDRLGTVASLGPWFVVPNDVLFLACIVAPACAYVSAGKMGQLWVGLACGLVFAAAWALESRCGLVAAALAYVSHLVLNSRPRPRTIFWPTGAALVVLVVGITATKDLASMEARVELWKQALCIVRHDPMLGVGPHNFGAAQGDCRSANYLTIDPRQTPWPHNIYLELAAETGLIGTWCATTVLAAFIVLVRTRLKQGQTGQVRTAVSMMLVLLFAGLIEASLLRQWVWTAFALALGWLRGPATTGPREAA